MNRMLTDARAWEAVVARDGTHDGRFVYAVATTGVYCRPGCGARRPLRRNVRFFPGGTEARAAGFRPCLRCRPDGVGGDARASDDVVLAAFAELDERFDENVGLAELAREVGASPSRLQRLCVERTGLSPKRYLASLRAARFRARVKAGDDVTRATYAAGFGSSRGLYQNARTDLGMTPSTYARGGDGLAIGWHCTSCELGRVLVATTDDGVCAVLLGDDDDELLGDLRREFPNAPLTPDPPAREAWVAAVVQHLDDVSMPLGVPLDHRGTPFQVRVWKALREIPAGETRSYAELAEAVGSPRAVRAVGSACAHNAIAVLVPCHRVVRKDGRSGGYRWGVGRKAALLAREAGVASGPSSKTP